MPYTFFKAKIWRGHSYPLKRSFLDAALLAGGVMDHVSSVHYREWSRSWGVKLPALRASFVGEDHKRGHSSRPARAGSPSTPSPRRSASSRKSSSSPKGSRAW
jgi:hypothetical protein